MNIKIPKSALKIPRNTPTANPPRKKDEGVHDLEQHFILRLPPGPAMALRHDIQSAAMNLKDRLSIEILPDLRHGRVTYGGHILNAKLVDLPCIIETLKTTDRKTFYKTADICQMLLCTMDDDSDSHDEHESPKKKDKEKKYQWNHGITQPMKNVSKRRFRKTLRKKYQEQPDIEKEVKRLFRMDNEAIDIKWEVVIEDEKQDNPESGEKQVLAHGGRNIANLSLDDIPGSSSMLEGYGDVGEHDIFGELSSSDEEGEAEKNVNVLDSGDDDGNQVILEAGLLGMATDTNMSSDGGMGEGELQQKLEDLGRQLEDIRERRMAQELEMAVINDDMMKERMQAQLDSIADEENKKQNEYEILSSMTG